MAPPLSVITIVKYRGDRGEPKSYKNIVGKNIMLINKLYIACHQLTLMSYKVLSVSLRSVHGNVEIHVMYYLRK